MKVNPTMDLCNIVPTMKRNLLICIIFHTYYINLKSVNLVTFVIQLFDCMYLFGVVVVTHSSIDNAYFVNNIYKMSSM